MLTLPYMLDDNTGWTLKTTRMFYTDVACKTLYLTYKAQSTLKCEVLLFIFEDRMKHWNPWVKPQFIALLTSLQDHIFCIIAFLLVTQEVIHDVSGRGCLPQGHEALGSKVSVTWIDPSPVITARWLDFHSLSYSKEMARMLDPWLRIKEFNHCWIWLPYYITLSNSALMVAILQTEQNSYIQIRTQPHISASK